MKSKNQGVYSASTTTRTQSIKSYALVIDATHHRYQQAPVLCMITQSISEAKKKAVLKFSHSQVISKEFHINHLLLTNRKEKLL